MVNKFILQTSLLIFFFIVNGMSGNSQDLEVDIKTFLETPKNYMASQVLAKEDGIYLAGISPATIGRNYTRYLVLPEARNGESYVKLPQLENESPEFIFLENTKGLTMLSSIVDKSKKTYSKIMQTIDNSGQVLSSKTISTTKINKKLKIGPFFSFSYSDNKQNVLLTEGSDFDNKKMKFESLLQVFNGELENINEWNFKSEKSQKEIMVMYSVVSNKGDIALLERRYKNEKAKYIIKDGKRKVLGFDYIFHHKHTDGTTNAITLDFEGHFVKDGNLICTPDNNYILFFPYYNDADQKSVAGFLSYAVDGTTLAITMNKHEFTNEEIKNFGAWDKKNPGLDKHFMLSPYKTTNGEKVAFAMERVEGQNGVRSGSFYGGMPAATIAKTRSLVAFSLDKNGKYIDYMHVPKAFNSQVAALTPFHFLDNQLHAFYVDNKKNLQRNANDYKKMKNGSVSSDRLCYAHQNDKQVERAVLAKDLGGGKIIQTAATHDDQSVYLLYYQKKKVKGKRGISVVSVAID